MHHVINLSQDFTALLVKTNEDTRATLQALSKEISAASNTEQSMTDRLLTSIEKARGEINDILTYLHAKVHRDGEHTRVRLEAFRNRVLELDASLGDGNDDGAKLIAEALAAPLGGLTATEAEAAAVPVPFTLPGAKPEKELDF